MDKHADKYPTTPRGKVPLSVKDPTAQDLLWEYADRRQPVDAEFSTDLRAALLVAGYHPAEETDVERLRAGIERILGTGYASVDAVYADLQKLIEE